MLWDAIRARHAAGCAVVIASHHLEEIEQLAQRVIVIDDGTVRADDALAAIVSSVARRRVTVRGVDADAILRLDASASVTSSDDGTVTAVLADSDAFVRALVAQHVPFADLTVRGATLEEAFLTLTKGAA